MSRHDEGDERPVTKSDFREFKSDIRREALLLIAAGSTLSGAVAGFIAKSPAAHSAALHLMHIFT